MGASVRRVRGSTCAGASTLDAHTLRQRAPGWWRKWSESYIDPRHAEVEGTRTRRHVLDAPRTSFPGCP
jgi:hypothetical protein